MREIVFPTQVVVEGLARVIVPRVDYKPGPGTKKMGVFYNPLMEFNRDVSILVFQQFVGKQYKKVLDGLAATGIRGIRFAREVEGDFSVTINDVNPIAYKLIKKNIEKNDVKNAFAENKRLNSLLSENRYDYIDIDPFGTPLPFIDSTMQSIKNKGVIGVTATDTAPLCGTYPKTCKRRYKATPLKTSYSHEIGLRILVGCVVREGAKYDLRIKPLIAHSIDHYFRAYLRVEKGAEKTDKNLRKIGYIEQKKDGSRNVFMENCILEKRIDSRLAGPLWIDSLFDKKFMENIEVKDYLGTRERIKKMLQMWRGEIETPPFYYTIGEIAKLTHVSPPPLEIIISELKKQGYKATKTYFDPTGFKANARIEVIKKIFKSE